MLVTLRPNRRATAVVVGPMETTIGGTAVPSASNQAVAAEPLANSTASRAVDRAWIGRSQHGAVCHHRGRRVTGQAQPGNQRVIGPIALGNQESLPGFRHRTQFVEQGLRALGRRNHVDRSSRGIGEHAGGCGAHRGESYQRRIGRRSCHPLCPGRRRHDEPVELRESLEFPLGARIGRLDDLDQRNVNHRGTACLEQCGQLTRTLTSDEHTAAGEWSRHPVTPSPEGRLCAESRTASDPEIVRGPGDRHLGHDRLSRCEVGEEHREATIADVATHRQFRY